MKGDPRQGLQQNKIKAMCHDYMTMTTTAVRQIAKQHSINCDRLRSIVRMEGCTMRGKDFALSQSRRRVKRSQENVFHGVPTTSLKGGTPEIEAAKTKLRRRGFVVYDATVTDGRTGKGFIYCDKEKITPQELLARAG